MTDIRNQHFNVIMHIISNSETRYTYHDNIPENSSENTMLYFWNDSYQRNAPGIMHSIFCQKCGNYKWTSTVRRLHVNHIWCNCPSHYRTTNRTPDHTTATATATATATTTTLEQ